MAPILEAERQAELAKLKLITILDDNNEPITNAKSGNRSTLRDLYERGTFVANYLFRVEDHICAIRELVNSKTALCSASRRAFERFTYAYIQGLGNYRKKLVNNLNTIYETARLPPEKNSKNADKSETEGSVITAGAIVRADFSGFELPGFKYHENEHFFLSHLERLELMYQSKRAVQRFWLDLRAAVPIIESTVPEPDKLRENMGPEHKPNLRGTVQTLFESLLREGQNFFDSYDEGMLEGAKSRADGR